MTDRQVTEPLTTSCSKSCCRGRVHWIGCCDVCAAHSIPVNFLPGHDAPADDVAMLEIKRLTAEVEELTKECDEAESHLAFIRRQDEDSDVLVTFRTEVEILRAAFHHDDPADCPTYYDGCHCVEAILGGTMRVGELVDVLAPAQWTRQQLQKYLESRGFAVYDHKDTETLREAVRLNMETNRR